MAGTIPIDMLIRERSLINDRRKVEARNIRQNTMHLSQERWDSVESSSFTKRLIPKVERWTAKKHGETMTRDMFSNIPLQDQKKKIGCMRIYHEKIQSNTTSSITHLGKLIEIMLEDL